MMEGNPDQPEAKPGYVRRYAILGRTVVQDPSTIKPLMRAALIKAWSAKGGGLYGLGFVIYFIVLELRMLVAEIIASDGIVEFIMEQALQVLMRFAIESLVNLVLALIWPAMLIAATGWIGIALLVLGFVAFERWGRTWVERQVPDLVLAKQHRVTEKQTRKETKKTEKVRKREEKRQKKREKKE